jgi:hypothetical protein
MEMASSVLGRSRAGGSRSRPGAAGACRLFLCIVTLGWIPRPPCARGQDIHWKSEFTFYGDNTEFTGPYREGETILGAQFETFFEWKPGARTAVLAGLFGEHRSGGDRFLDPVKPILSFRYQTPTSLGVLGTLETRDRHGYLEPLEVRTLEFDRPIEYGVQWIESRPAFHADLYLNWQHLNTPESREIFDYGGVLRGRLAPFAELEGQVHGLHHGGQLYDVGPVSNDVVYGPGLRLATPRSLPILGTASLAMFRLFSKGKVDPFVDTPTVRGNGTYLRGAVTPFGFVEVFWIWWHGRNFISTEGDANYASAGENGFYRADRRYQEIGLVRKNPIEANVTLDAEIRLHRIDGKISYSYRLVVRAPFDWKIH